ncbi:Protein P [Labeo rohita]|uniref:ribonuclease H n=1 Tax=Labeo rohita TaxID=84645 RepID=A0ABQ8L9Z0_LABRO|nr:Protein P [Labeo rohita]
MFTKCMDAALAPLRLQGIRVLNYLDNWLILAHSMELVSHHRDVLLHHIQSLGLRLNTKKSVLTPSQQTVFLEVHLDSIQMQACLAPARISSLNACLARFKLGHHVSVGTCRRLLGLMAAASPELPLGLLHMRLFLWWMKLPGICSVGPASRLVRVTRSCFHNLSIWWDPLFLNRGVRMGAVHRHQMVTTEASLMGWGAVFEGRPACRVWT